MKKTIRLINSCLLVFILFFSASVHASDSISIGTENPREISEKLINDKFHQFTVKFTSEANTLDLKNNIVVLDQNQNKLDVNLNVLDDGKTITIDPPKNGYADGNYSILIKNTMVSKLGHAIKSSVKMKFVINTSSPSLKLSVLSDIHYYDPTLGTTGKAFEDYLAGDRKLLAESSAVFDSAVNNLKNSDSNVVLISGDLTKDGELIDHQDVAKSLKEIEASGKKVYVIDGNHDILNPNAVRFNGDTTSPVDHITPAQFKDIYAEFGYNEAIAKDPNSLSYVVEPTDGVRIIAIDSCEYNTNIADNYPKTAGSLNPERLQWVLDQVKDAKKNNKLIIGMMHHGVVQHFGIQEQFFPEYLLDNWKTVSDQLADAGLNMVFTGHFHAQDAVSKTTSAGNTIYDIETGSLVTYPCPYREVQIKAGKVDIQTNKIDKIDYDTGNKSFPEYAKGFLEDGMKKLVPEMLSGVYMKQGMSSSQALQLAQKTAQTQLAPQVDPSITVGSMISNAMIKHYIGDETIDPTTKQIVERMVSSKDTTVQMLGNAIMSILTDLPPSDNNLQIDLKSLNKN